MKTLLLFGAMTCGLALSAPARAEALRCTGGIVDEGDSRLSLIHKCGQPVLRDSYCAAVYYSPSGHQVPDAIAGIAAPCLPTEEWLYERGPGSFPATVRLRAGKVTSITHGQPR